MLETSEIHLESLDKVKAAIFEAIDDVNLTLPADRHFKKEMDAEMMGSGGGVDSLGLTMLIVALEQKIEEEFDSSISLVDVNTMSTEHSPFRTLNMLISHIYKLIEEKSNG